jgi:hypothetical protein
MNENDSSPAPVSSVECAEPSPASESPVNWIGVAPGCGMAVIAGKFVPSKFHVPAGKLIV